MLINQIEAEVVSVWLLKDLDNSCWARAVTFIKVKMRMRDFRVLKFVSGHTDWNSSLIEYKVVFWEWRCNWIIEAEDYLTSVW